MAIYRASAVCYRSKELAWRALRMKGSLSEREPFHRLSLRLALSHHVAQSIRRNLEEDLEGRFTMLIDPEV